MIQMANNNDNSKVVHSLIKSLGKYLKILGSNTLDGLMRLLGLEKQHNLLSNFLCTRRG